MICVPQNSKNGCPAPTFCQGSARVTCVSREPDVAQLGQLFLLLISAELPMGAGGWPRVSRPPVLPCPPVARPRLVHVVVGCENVKSERILTSRHFLNTCLHRICHRWIGQRMPRDQIQNQCGRYKGVGVNGAITATIHPGTVPPPVQPTAVAPMVHMPPSLLSTAHQLEVCGHALSPHMPC